MIQGLHHVGISVTDLDRAIEFYTKMLDMELAAAFPFDGPLYSQVMGLPNAQGRMGVVRKGSLMLELFELRTRRRRRRIRTIRWAIEASPTLESK